MAEPSQEWSDRTIHRTTSAADNDLLDRDACFRMRQFFSRRWEAAAIRLAVGHDPPERSVAMASIALEPPESWVQSCRFAPIRLVLINAARSKIVGLQKNGPERVLGSQTHLNLSNTTFTE